MVVASSSKMAAGSGYTYTVKNNDPAQRRAFGGHEHTAAPIGVLCLQLFGEGGAAEIKGELNKISS